MAETPHFQVGYVSPPDHSAELNERVDRIARLITDFARFPSDGIQVMITNELVAYRTRWMEIHRGK